MREGFRVLRDAVFLFVLVDSRVGHRESKRGFRVLRDATQGNGARVLGTWPNKSTTALRENAPQGPFQIPQGSRKAGESFISPAGGNPLLIYSCEKISPIAP